MSTPPAPLASDPSGEKPIIGPGYYAKYNPKTKRWDAAAYDPPSPWQVAVALYYRLASPSATAAVHGAEVRAFSPGNPAARGLSRPQAPLTSTAAGFGGFVGEFFWGAPQALAYLTGCPWQESPFGDNENADNALGAALMVVDPALGLRSGLRLGGRLAANATRSIGDDVARLGWRLGDDITAPTRGGGKPAWSTVRSRYWKNAAARALDGEHTADNLTRMSAGRPPLHPVIGVPMELHHATPRFKGGSDAFDNLRALWPWDHAAVDPFRFYNGQVP